MKPLRKILTSNEFRGALILIPSLIVCAIVLRRALDPDYVPTPPYEAAAQIDSLNSQRSFQHDERETIKGDSLFMFDPNTIDYHSLLALGFSRNEALGIVKFRARGKRFEIKEDFASCYTVSEDMYRRLEPYIAIGKEFALKPFKQKEYHAHHYDTSRRYARRTRDTLALTPFRLDTASISYLSKIGFSVRQAEVLVKYRDMRGGLRTIDEVAECYVVSDEMLVRLQPYLIFDEEPEATDNEPQLIELNRADSTALVSIRGIGAKSAMAIIDYRQRLGGFHKLEQLSEVRGITERNYELIVQQIWCDSSKIKKIYINFARPKELELHPYITDRTLKRIINHRELKGGWSTIEEMIDKNILSHDEAARIAPYLDFGTNPEE